MIEPRRFFCVLAYDIGDNKRRYKLSKLIEAFGFRVQGSVFEGYLTNPELEKIIQRSKKVLDLSEDSLRIYPICGACRQKMMLIGCGDQHQPPELIII